MTTLRVSRLLILLTLVFTACTDEEPPRVVPAPSPSPEASPEVLEPSPEPPPKPERVQVPNVEGKKWKKHGRLDRILTISFVVSISTRPSDETPGTVLQQRPQVGARRQPGALVRLVVAKPRPEPPPEGERGNCTPGYSPCLPPASDYDCSGGEGDGPEYTGTVTVTGSDPYGLDGDGDGVGCE